mmetsp:Transcript_27389/g.26458  ORF Transcript_27389/g.26458 Transcript_27389/m.26458 type:complete len:81 (+) Transcript_27389:361-603(+)
MQGGGDRSYGDRSFGARPSGGGGNSTTLFVGNLKFDSNEDGLMNVFSKCGDINQVRIARDQEGNARGFAHIEFGSVEAAQ